MKNVVYFTVDRRLLPVALATASALAAEKQRTFEVVILLNGPSEARLIVPDGVQIVPNDLERMVPAEVKTRSSWGRTSFTRIFAPLSFRGRYQRALYLDADVAVFGAVSPLFGLDMKSHPLAAVEGMMDEGAALHRIDLKTYKAALGIKDGRTFNSGVLLIDIPEWELIDHATSLRNYWTERSSRSSIGIGMSGDQDYLNSSLTGRWLNLSPRWNFQTFLLRLALEDLIDPAIVHYVGPRRPWEDQLFPYGNRHIGYYRDRFDSIGFDGRRAFRSSSSAWRSIADRLREFTYNRLATATKVRMFEEWRASRAIFKAAIAKRIATGQYEDVEQGISAIALDRDPLAGTEIDDIVYYRKRIRVKSSLRAG